MAAQYAFQLTILAIVAASFVSGIEFPASALLSKEYYEKRCPFVQDIVKEEMALAVLKETRMAASIIRLHFHDCFVQGCDASVLLDDTPFFTGEKTAVANLNSLRGYEVIDNIKEKLEAACPGVVSCADIIALAARDATILAGGPYWDVPLGRKDSRTASLDKANQHIPMPNASLPNLISKFMVQGLTITDMVALVGSHTIGKARCTSFRDRLYKSALMGGMSNELHASVLKSSCPQSGGDDNLASLDEATPTLFDNAYYTQLINGEGLLDSDQAMYEASIASTITSGTVRVYAYDALAFSKQFADSMVKMGNILDPLALTTGEVRKNCRRVNL